MYRQSSEDNKNISTSGIRLYVALLYRTDIMDSNFVDVTQFEKHKTGL